MPRRAQRHKRRMSLTSLIDVIFLLLLFFMLTSTFSKFAEVELTSASGGATSAAPAALPPLFLQLGPDNVTLNGTNLTLEGLGTALNDSTQGSAQAPQTLLVSLAPQVTAQRLTDLLVTLRNRSDLSVAVLGTDT